MPWRIDDDLYVSGTPSVRMLQQLPPIQTVVTLCAPSSAPKPNTVEYMQQHGITHLKHPVPDGRVLHVDRYQAAARAVWERLQAGDRVLVHCAAGRNRSVLIATMVMMKRYGWRGAEAIARVRELRPNALANPVTVAWLETFT